MSDPDRVSLHNIMQCNDHYCKHIRSAVIGLAHALCRGTWQARRCVVIVLVLRNSGCTTVYNKSKLTVTEAHTTTLQLYTQKSDKNREKSQQGDN